MASPLEQGILLQRQGRLTEAEALYRAVLGRTPDDAGALHYLGLVNYQTGRLADAEAFMSRSLEIDRASPNTWNDLGAVKVKRGLIEEGVRHFARALELRPGHVDALGNIAAALRQLFRFESSLAPLRVLSRLRPRSAEALRTLADSLYHTGAVSESIDLHRRALRLDPANRAARTGLAEACEAAGRFKEARWHYAAVLRRDPDNVSALSKVLQLREGAVREEWVAKARQIVERPVIGGDAEGYGDPGADARSRLNIGLAHHFDRVGAYESAFRHLQEGRGHHARFRPFDSNGYSAAVDALIAVLGAEFFRTAPRTAHGDRRPIFIVGMPRSGTTLTEQVLASHPRVAAGGELAALPQASLRIQELAGDGQPYPFGLPSMSRDALEMLARGYSSQLDRIDSTGRRVTDKLPFNFMHLGVIALLFPGATVVHCRRDPMDNCTSCFFTSFADEVAFANDLGTLGRYYADYDRLMKHWRQVLPLKLLELRYEDMVGDTESTIRKLLAHCDLEWDPACLRFHQTQRGIRTPSRWQVRQPIYGHSVARWRRYQRHLQPLAAALGPVLTDTQPP